MDRSRLTITIKKNILKDIDNLIDGTKIRNRSHAIEYLISKSLQPKIDKVVILAGGRGVKMRPLTYEIPKPLIPVHSKPILEHTIELLRKNEFRDIIIATGHLGNKIKEHFGNGSQFGIRISYSQEYKSLGTAGALKNAAPLIGKQSFIVFHGDILVQINLKELVNYYENAKKIATMALTTKVDTSDYGIVRLRGGNIVEFIEKPSKKQQVSQLINAGIYVFNWQIFNYIDKNKYVMLEEIFPILAKEEKLSGFLFEGKWFDVSTPKHYEEAIKKWS